MIDVDKLRYDLALQSALAATVLNRNSDESVYAQMLKEFSAAYNEYSLQPSKLLSVINKARQSEQLCFEAVNALSKGDSQKVL